MQHANKDQQRESWRPLALVSAICSAVWLLWGFVVMPLLRSSEAAAGQFGDSFGGINALFTALAFAAVWWTGWMQRIELTLQREELALQRGELADTRSVFKRQNFESAFYAQIGLVRDIKATASYRGYSGQDAFDLASKDTLAQLNLAKDNPDAAIRQYTSHMYPNGQTFLGPFFRTLFHLFKLIDTQEYLTDKERNEYASLARAQLGSEELQMLALNAATSLSEDFLPLIEKYGLLKHLPEEYRDSAIFVGRVKRTAFMSAAERKSVCREGAGE